jgi:signal transduction histidine kinase
MGQTAANTPRSPAVPARQFEDPALKGTFHVTVTSLINNEGAHVGAVMVARDVTEQARLEAERALLHQRLAQSEKLAALGQFVAGIAHELNNPLQGVLGHLELMKATGELSRSQRRGLQTAYREADRAAKIVSNLLVFAGSGKRVRRRCSLNRILRRALALRAGRLRRARIRVVRRLDERQPRLLGDPLLLQQAFLNIILNAEQAMSGGSGRLEVSSAVADRGRWAAVRVRDTGPGLSVIARDRLFEPFFTTKDVGDGTGLGLAIAYGIIQDHGGEILADNHPQGGARFTVRLPTDRLVIK